MIREIDLGVVVLQMRDDERWRLVPVDLLEAERRGELALDEDDWINPAREIDAGRLPITGGQTFVLAHVVDGLPDRVTAGDAEVDVQVVGGVWVATWGPWEQRVVVRFGGTERIIDMSRRPAYRPSEDGRGWSEPSVGRHFHVTSVANRASIDTHGLDSSRMGAARGIAGSAEPEADGCFLVGSKHEADWFVQMNNTGGDVDVWAVDNVDETMLVDNGNGNGYLYLPGTIARRWLTLVERDLPSVE